MVVWLVLFAGWTLATWALEGRIRTLLRPDALVDRLLYIGTANLMVGLLGAAVLVRCARGAGAPKRDASPARVLVSVLTGAALGLALLLAVGPPASPWAIVNGYAQVMTVTVAEVAVCWWALHHVLAVWRPEHERLAAGATVALGAASFGLYHFAHSPPFDTWSMVGGLTLMGLVTGAFFVASGDLYGAVALHNFAGTIGVLNALRDGGRLAGYEEPRVATLIAGALALAALVALDVLVARRAPDGAARS